MADELNLNADETVVDRIGKVGYGGFLSFNNDLVLTNQNIILVKKESSATHRKRSSSRSVAFAS